LYQLLGGNRPNPISISLMRRTIARVRKPIFVAIALSGCFLGYATFLIDMVSLIWIFAYIPIIVLAVAGILFILLMLGMAIATRKRIYLLAIAIVLSAGLITTTYHESLSLDVRCFLLRPYYTIQMMRVQAGITIAGVKQEEQFVAFEWYRGLNGNGVGLAYAAQGALSLPVDSDVFVGYVYNLRSLGGGWYLCYFT
jgi:hypothetical protein